MRTTRWRYLLALLIPLSLLLAACGDDKNDDEGGGGSTPSGSEPAASGDPIRLVPQDFNESRTLTEVYGQYLEAKGFKVEIQDPSGFRDVVYPALDDAKADLLIDYTGSATRFIDENSAPSADAEETYGLLTDALAEKSYQALDYSPAADQNALVVLKSFAEENDLTTISDLKPIEAQVVFGASADCLDRPDCLLGYQSADFYGLKFKDVKTVEYGPPLAAGLENDSLQAVQYQTTAAEIESGDFIVLEDDKGMLSADNVVPIIQNSVVDTYGEDITTTINELSAKLTTEDLISWNARTDIDKDDPEVVAKEWLEEKGLI